MFKKALAVALAATMVLGMASVASADMVITDGVSDGYSKVDGGNFYYDVGAWCDANGVDVSTVGGVIFTIQVDTLDAGFGGGAIFNTSTDGAVDSNWVQKEWGNADAAKEISAVEVGDMTYTVSLIEAGHFSTTEDQYGVYNNVALSSWWGSDFVVTAVTVVDESGAALGGAASTGAVAPVMVFALVAVASAAVVVSSKKRA